MSPVVLIPPMITVPSAMMEGVVEPPWRSGSACFIAACFIAGCFIISRAWALAASRCAAFALLENIWDPPSEIRIDQFTDKCESLPRLARALEIGLRWVPFTTRTSPAATGTLSQNDQELLPLCDTSPAARSSRRRAPAELSARADTTSDGRGTRLSCGTKIARSALTAILLTPPPLRRLYPQPSRICFKSQSNPWPGERINTY